jgi:uncharacterized membrane-anchored protein
MHPATTPHDSPHFPPEDATRAALHHQLLARPQARMGLPVQMAYIVVLNADIDLETERLHLAKLPGQKDLAAQALQRHFLRVPVGPCTLKWERHAEFTSYTIMRALPPSTLLNDDPQKLVSQLLLDDGWLQNIPGKTLAAIHLVMLLGDPPHAVTRATAYDHWFADGSAVASLMGTPPHSAIVTDFALQPDGFERLLVTAAPGMSEARAGRVAQRLLEIETYRLLALRRLPLALQLTQELADCERVLATLIDALDDPRSSLAELLDTLVPLATRVARMATDHTNNFDASAAYQAMVTQRLGELREKAIAGTQTFSEFIQRRLSPAVATVDATARHMDALAARITRTGALLQSRTDMATQAHQTQLLQAMGDTQVVLRRVQRTLQILAFAGVALGLVCGALMVAGRL